jgi:pimeloyl-ACP methyl ester carboxylesterase
MASWDHRFMPEEAAAPIAGSDHAAIERLAASARVRDVATPAGRVRWRCFGAGAPAGGAPPVALLHGGHGCWLHWVRNIGALAAGRAVWVADLPGFGDSDSPAGPAMDALLDMTAASLRDLSGPGQAIDLVGFSFGGLVAAHLATDLLPVRRIALLGPAGHAGRRRPRGEMIAWRRVAHDAPALAAALRHNLAMQMLHDEQAIDDLALAVHTRACQGTRFRSREISRAGGLPELLARCPAPLLLAWGEHDSTADPKVLAATLGLQAPQREAVVLPGVGHWVQYEAAAAINRLLLGFLGD